MTDETWQTYRAAGDRTGVQAAQQQVGGRAGPPPSHWVLVALSTWPDPPAGLSSLLGKTVLPVLPALSLGLTLATLWKFILPLK